MIKVGSCPFSKSTEMVIPFDLSFTNQWKHDHSPTAQKMASFLRYVAARTTIEFISFINNALDTAFSFAIWKHFIASQKRPEK